MLKIAIVDDEEECLDSLKKNLVDIFDEINVPNQISTFKNGLNFIQSLKNSYDIIFLDIEMDHVNGIELAKKIREVDENVMIIFQTKMGKYAVQGYSVNAFDYILKPIDFNNLKLKMHRALLKLRKKEGNTITINTNNGTVFLNIDSIHYIEVMSHLLVFHTEKGDFSCYGKMNDIEEKIKAKNFVRISRSFIINSDYVTSTKGNSVFVLDKELTIGRTYRKIFSDFLNKFVMF